MSLTANLSGSTSRNGSVNSSSSISQGNAFTNGSAASAQSLANMREANEFTEKMWRLAADFNMQEAQKQRDWQERLSNSTYQRTVQDMIKAGINPILAAGAGLGADSISSGATASMSGAASAMASATPDSISSSYGASEGHGSSWGESDSGLAVGLKMLGESIGNAISQMNSGGTIVNLMDTVSEKGKETYNSLIERLFKDYPKLADFLGLEYTQQNSGEAPGRKKNVTGSAKVGGTKSRNDGKGYLKGGIYGLLEQ